MGKENRGRLIVVEGAVDGIGKTTQFEKLHTALTNAGQQVVCHHFPSYGTPAGAAVEAYLRGDYGTPEELSPYFINCLYAADRAAVWQQTLSAAYRAGSTVLLDRYTTSSLIYQSALLKSDSERRSLIDYITDFEYGKLGIAQPDLVVFLTAPYKVAAALRAARTANEGVANDIHERDGAFLRRVYESAGFCADYLGWQTVQCAKNGAMRSIQDIHQEILALTEQL